METVKDVLNFCNAVVFYVYKNIGIIDELNQARKSMINIFHETIPIESILIALSIIDVVILKINDYDIENVIENIDDLRSNILNMLSFQKVIREKANENNSEPEC